jgi:cytochrome c biogenesis protein
VSSSLSPGDMPSLSPIPAQTLPSRRRGFPEKLWELLACFRSVQLAIVLLSLLALATLAGVLLPQDGLVETAEIKANFGTNYRLFKAMGFFNVYSSYWFISLEVLFFFNLLIGSFKWLKPAWLAATRTTFRNARQIKAGGPRQLAFTTALLPEALVFRLTTDLRKARYGVKIADLQADGSRLLYASKGNFSRLGPATAHVGILLMLLSSVYGVFFGFKAQELAVPGQTFDIAHAQMFKPNIDANFWLGSKPPWKVHVNDFTMIYYAPGETSMNPQPGVPATVKQYYADLSIVDTKGKTLKRETISVNHPLSMGDTTIYQASFSPTGKLFLEVNGKPMTIKTNTRFMNRPVSLTELGNGKALLAFPFFMQQDPNIDRNQAVFFIKDNKGFVGAQHSAKGAPKMPPNLRLEEGQNGVLAGMRIRYIKPEIATGLQIKKGPEVPWMYLSYLIIIGGTILCIFSQRRIWLAIDSAEDGHSGSTLRISYLANKAHISFAKELRQLEARWREQDGLQLQTLEAAATTTDLTPPDSDAQPAIML